MSIGLYKNGQGYTVIGSEGYTYLDMPESIYEFFKDYPGDFRLVNEQFLFNLAKEQKPVILETPWSTLQKLDSTSAYWEVETLKKLDYILRIGEGPNGYDVLLPSK